MGTGFNVIEKYEEMIKKIQECPDMDDIMDLLYEFRNYLHKNVRGGERMTKDKGYVLNEEENLYECAGCGITITDLRVKTALSNDGHFELSCRHCGGEIGENFLNAPTRHNLREMEL